MFSRPRFRYYEENETIDAANITILKQVFTAARQIDTLYFVRYDCCGHTAEISHHKIAARGHKVTERCFNCRVKKGNKSVLMKIRQPLTTYPAKTISWPEWAKPPSVPSGENTLWER